MRLLFAVLLAACAPEVVEPELTPASPNEQPGRALVFFTLASDPPADPLGPSPDPLYLRANGRYVADYANLFTLERRGQWLRLYMAPGTYSFELEAENGEVVLAMDPIDLRAGDRTEIVAFGDPAALQADVAVRPRVLPDPGLINLMVWNRSADRADLEIWLMDAGDRVLLDVVPYGERWQGTVATTGPLLSVSGVWGIWADPGEEGNYSVVILDAAAGWQGVASIKPDDEI